MVCEHCAAHQGGALSTVPSEVPTMAIVPVNVALGPEGRKGKAQIPPSTFLETLFKAGLRPIEGWGCDRVIST